MIVARIHCEGNLGKEGLTWCWAYHVNAHLLRRQRSPKERSRNRALASGTGIVYCRTTKNKAQLLYLKGAIMSLNGRY